MILCAHSSYDLSGVVNFHERGMISIKFLSIMPHSMIYALAKLESFCGFKDSRDQMSDIWERRFHIGVIIFISLKFFRWIVLVQNLVSVGHLRKKFVG